MMRYGYDMRLATGVIAASGTITQLIPPSLVLVVLADQLGRSVGDMYLGAIGPSIVQVALFCLYILSSAIVRPAAVPALPPEARTLARLAARLASALRGMVPSLALIFLVLGTILLGLATPTEGGRHGRGRRDGARRDQPPPHLAAVWQAMDTTMRITAMVVFILIGSTVFSLGLPGRRRRRVDRAPADRRCRAARSASWSSSTSSSSSWRSSSISSRSPSSSSRCWRRSREKLGIDLIWFGVLLCVNMQTSFMHPPFGFALFYLRGIAPAEVKTNDIYLGRDPLGRAAAGPGGGR